MNVHRPSRSCTLAEPLAGLLLCLPLAAQAQFAESVKTYVPHQRNVSQTVRAADFDRDGDLDLLQGNSHIVAGEQMRLLRNDGTGTFADVTQTHLPVGVWHTNGLAIGARFLNRRDQTMVKRWLNLYSNPEGLWSRRYCKPLSLWPGPVNWE